MNSIEHYFENLLTLGSDIKGEPNKNALSKEVQEAVEICADYIKFEGLIRLSEYGKGEEDESNSNDN